MNVNVSPDAHRRAKEAAEKAGMLLRKWIERAMLREADAEQGKFTPVERKERYAPLDD